MRPIADVPRPVVLALTAALILQVSWYTMQPSSDRQTHVLPPPPSLPTLQIASLGEPVALSKALMLYVQSTNVGSNDNKLRDWLVRILELDPRSQYPLLAASQVYAGPDSARTRLMLDFVYTSFANDPDRRWPWLAHATLVAKHQLKDLPLARLYAQAIRTQTTPGNLPSWARQMEIFILDDMNELAAAKTLIGAMLASGQVTDPHELAFLERRLAAISARQAD